MSETVDGMLRDAGRLGPRRWTACSEMVDGLVRKTHEARESHGAVELVVSLGEPHQAGNPSRFTCGFDDVAAFAGSLRVEQLNLLEKTRS